MINNKSTELFINMKNVPTWDRTKHFYEQSRETSQFYMAEWEKITKGVTIGGYFFHPWLYWHINYFKTPIPVPTKQGVQDVIMCPPLDDNTLYVIESYKEAEEQNKGLILFGTRGFAKSTLLTSLAQWTATTKANGTTSIIGGNQNDLDALSSLMETAFTEVHPAFSLPIIKKDWSSQVTVGYKENAQTNIVHSNISVTNVNKGGKNSSEKGAGLSPMGYIQDEIGKYDCLGVFQSAVPSFRTPYGYRLTPTLSGTGGNTELSQDAKKLLTNPEAYDLIMCNYSLLDRNVPEEAITWKDTKQKKFSVFVPAQMSLRVIGDVQKTDTNMQDFMGLKSPDLKKIKVKQTDWIKATNSINEHLASIKDRDAQARERMYYPLNIDDCFLTNSYNPFPEAIIRRHIEYLEEKGKIGKDIEIIRENGVNKASFINRPRAEVSHPGGHADAPIILFGELPEKPLPRGSCVSGLDGYKLDASDSDSLGSLYVLNRRYLTTDSPCETIAASYTARPQSGMKEFHQNCQKVIEAFDAECLMESVDMGFKQFLEHQNKTEQLLAPAINFNSILSHKNKLNSKYGLYPSKQNNQYRFNLLVGYCKEVHILGVDDEGNEVTKYGVEYIDDIDLLKEMLNFYEGGNYDRITAFSHALVYARELDKHHIRPKQERDPNEVTYHQKQEKVGKYGKNRRAPKYSRSRKY